MAQKSFAQEYESVGSFLVLELLALISFGLGGINVIFQYAGFIVSLIAAFFAFRNYSKEDLKPILYIGIPLLLMSVFTSFGKFFESYSILANLGAFLSIISFFAMGLSARRLKSFSAKNALLCIGGGLALLTLISTIITWAQYGLFYSLIYRGTPNYYYNGNLYSVLDEMVWLNGFKVSEVSQAYGGLFSVLSACFLPALLFIKAKENKVTFIVFAVIGGIGLLSIITIPNFMALIFVAIAFVAALFYRFLRTNKLAVNILRYTILAVFAILIIGFFFAMLNIAIPEFNSFVAGNSFLNRLFNSNKIMTAANPVLEAALKPFNLFGINTLEYHDGYKIANSVILSSTGVFEIEIIKEGGIIAFILFIIFVMFAYESFAKYLKRSKDADFVKVSLLGFLIVFVLYSTFFNDVFPLTHDGTSYNPFTRSLPFLIVLFIIGYTVLPSGKDEIVFNEISKPEKEKKQYVDDDYTFSDVEEEELL